MWQTHFGIRIVSQQTQEVQCPYSRRSLLPNQAQGTPAICSSPYMMAPVIHDDDDAVLMTVIMDSVRISGADRCWCVISCAQNEGSLEREVADSFMSSLGPQLRVEKMHFLITHP